MTQPARPPETDPSDPAAHQRGRRRDRPDDARDPLLRGDRACSSRPPAPTATTACTTRRDLERLRFIKSLRDDAGFSLAQIGQLLEDEAARERNRERAPDDRAIPPSAARSSIDARDRVDRQIEILEAKAAGWRR